MDLHPYRRLIVLAFLTLLALVSVLLIVLIVKAALSTHFHLSGSIDFTRRIISAGLEYW